jgi:hypothetical protein
MFRPEEPMFVSAGNRIGRDAVAIARFYRKDTKA